MSSQITKDFKMKSKLRKYADGGAVRTSMLGDGMAARAGGLLSGRGRQVEGPDLAGKRVIVLEDTSTTGGSPLAAIEALLKVGAEIAAVAVVVDRDTGAREIIEAAGYPYYFAIGLDDLGLSK